MLKLCDTLGFIMFTIVVTMYNPHIMEAPALVAQKKSESIGELKEWFIERYGNEDVDFEIYETNSKS